MYYNSVSPNITKLIDVSQELIVSVEECGKWLNLSSSSILKNNDILESLIKSTTEIIEDYTWLSLRQKTFEAYYDLGNYLFTDFVNGNLKLNLERSPILELENITKIEYLDNDQWVEFDRGAMTIEGLYDNVTEKLEQRKWASIKFRENVPFQGRCNAYKIRNTFISGYDPVETDVSKKVPEVIKLAIKEIVAFHYTQRGDCATECTLDGFPVPCLTKGMLDQISIKGSVIGTTYNPASSSYGGVFGCNE